jgi:hypothetical protein
VPFSMQTNATNLTPDHKPHLMLRSENALMWLTRKFFSRW